MFDDLFAGLEAAPEPRVLLAVFAHPDDEAFTCGGTLAITAASGGRVHLLCATRGELGEIADPALATPDTLGVVREQELRAACHALGIDAPTFLGYRDSGMAGTPGNDDPRAFCRVPTEQVARQVTEAVRRLRPQVVLTFESTGGYGHPDHIAIHRAAVAAFDSAGDPARFPEQVEAGLAPHRPERLAYIAIPRSVFRSILELVRREGIDPGEAPFPEDAGFPDELIDVVVDVSAQLDLKVAGLLAHRTQLDPRLPWFRLPEAALREAMRREHFVLGAGPGARAG